MTESGIYTDIFEASTVTAGGLLLTHPDEIEKRAGSAAAAAWELLLGSMLLRRAGQRSLAGDWLNRASGLFAADDLFKAELLGEAGRNLFEGDRLDDAAEILNSALAIWRDVCEEARRVIESPKSKAAGAFTARLRILFEAAKIRPPALAGPEIVGQWLEERAVLGRAETAAAFIRVLCKARQAVDAMEVCAEEMRWIARTFGTPFTRAARRAQYLLLLARGEANLAAGELAVSADDFDEAASLYVNKAEDYNDINRLLRAKFNQANSLLRLKRTRDALGIYEMCEHGFHSIGDAAAAQRVAQAKVLAKAQGAGDDKF